MPDATPEVRRRDDIDLFDFLNLSLSRAFSRMRILFEQAILHPRGMTVAEWRILLIATSLADAHVRQISRTTGLDATYVARVTRGLEARGWLAGQKDARDGRIKRLVVTPEGHAVIDDIWPEAVAMSRRVAALMGEDRYRELRAALDVIRNLAADDLFADRRDAAE